MSEVVLAPEEIARLGKEFIAAVMADESEPVIESKGQLLVHQPGIESFLLESNFTGVLTDRLGHKQHYVDGKHVAGPTAIDVSHAAHPKAKDLAEQAVKLWGDNAKAKLEEAIAKHSDNADPAAQRKVMAAKVALAGLAKHHDIGDFDLGKEFAEPAPEKPKPLPDAPNVAPAPENVVKSKPHEKVEAAADLDAAHATLKKLYDSATDDPKIFEKVDEAMASVKGALTVPQLKTLAGKMGINDVRGSKDEIVSSISRKIKDRREQHERTKK